MALPGLTRRGIGLLAAGVAVLVAGLVGDVQDLLRLGGFLLVLPLAALAVVAAGRFRLSCSRTMEPARVEAGLPARITLRLRNVSRLPTALLLAEDQVPAALGGKPHFTLDRVEGGGQRAASYTITPLARGRYPLGPLTLRVTDPLGLCTTQRSFTDVDELVVTPAAVTLPGIRIPAEWSGAGEARSSLVSSVGDDDIATRPYRDGDDLRRVHWRTTARTGELMVRREEQPWRNRATLLLDCRGSAHRGAGLDTSLEVAVEAVAAFVVHLARRGFDLRLVTDRGDCLADARAADAEALALERLADLGTTRSTSLASGVEALGAGGSLVLAVCGALQVDDVAALTAARGNAVGLAFLLDVRDWARQPQGGGRTRSGGGTDVLGAELGAAADRLRWAGWGVIVLDRSQQLPAAWLEAGRVLSTSGRP